MSQAAFEPKAAPVARSLSPAIRPLVQRKCACGGAAGPDGECENCQRNRQRVQRSATSVSAPATAPESVHRTLASPGRPLDSGERHFMESRFGHDFSNVRIHTDTQAGESARAINAHAYTVGNDIAFAPGKYQPDSFSGRSLLAHELAHTVQQSGLQRKAGDLAVDTAPDSRLEHEADNAAHAVMHGSGAPTIASRPRGGTISRAKGDISTKPIIGRPPKKVTTTAGFSHTVTPTGEGTLQVDDAGAMQALEEFSVDPFFLPGEKGPAAFDIFDKMATGGSLEATLELTGSKTKTALWQERPKTDELRDIWLKKVGWAGQTQQTVNDLWQRSGGDKEFPKVNQVTAQMDHIVELQIGGNNTEQNIQPLDPKRNQSSGGAIKSQLQALAQAIANDKSLSAGPQQVKMRFTKVKPYGAVKPVPATCPPPKGTTDPLAIEACALKLKVTQGQDGSISVAREDYIISAGGRPTKLRVPTTFAGRADETVEIKEDTENAPASTLIPGLLLRTLAHRAKTTAKPDAIATQIDDRDKTRLPITINSDTKPFNLSVAADGTLTLPASLKKTEIGFTYKYLSPGKIKSVQMNANGGIDFTGQITPTAKFLPTLDVEYKDGVLRLVAKIPEDKLKKASLFGAKVTAASVDIVLSPAFDITGNIDFILGSETNPAGVGKLTLGKDDQGIVGTAKLNLKIPKVDTTEITFEYKGGAERDQWTGEVKIETSQIKVPYVTGSTIVARVSSKNGVVAITFEGKVDLELPNNRGTAEVSLKRYGSEWFFGGLARLSIPKTEDFSAGIVYNITRESLEVTVPGEGGKAPAKPIKFTITEDLKGTLDRFRLTVAKGGVVTMSGGGGITFKRGKASGKVNVDLAADGSFSGEGTITYALSENLTVEGTVAFKEKGQPKLAIKGSLTFKRLELMKAISDNRTLFEKDFTIPIPYASIGGVGLNAFFGVKLEAGYSLGPIVIEPLIFTAGFNPLEDEPQLNLGASGELKVPCSATLSASLSGGVKIEAYIAEIGGKVTITGTIKLEGGLFVPFKGTYNNQEFAVEMTPEAKLKLLLGVMLSATVWAEVGVGWLSKRAEKTWILAKREVDTKLGFGIKAPVSYSSKTGAKIPSLDQIQFIPPEFTKDNLSRIANELFYGAKGEPADA